MNEWILIAGMAGVTFLLRYPLLALSGRLRLAPAFVTALRFVPPAVLTAIVVPAVLIPDGQGIVADWTNARLVGALVALAVGLWTRNLLATILAGMATFLIWQWALSQF